MTDPAVTVRPKVWRLLAGQELRHYCWDGSVLLYNDCSGDTHLLEAGAMRVLLALRTAPRGEAELAACYTGSCAPVAGMTPVGALLDDLAALSLVECAPC